VRAGPPGDGEGHALTAARGAKRWPFEDALALASLRKQLEALGAFAEAPPLEQRVASVQYVAQRSARALREAPEADTYRAALQELGPCVADETLTPLGLAACELRTCGQPHQALAALLQSGALAWPAALAFASQVLAEGSGDDAELPLPPDLQAALARLPARTARSWTAAVLRWAEGAELVDLAAALPVGCFCRHVTRVADACEELAEALRALGAAAGGEPFLAAQQQIVRGLPFAKRGAWKAAVVELDAAPAADPARCGGLDLEALFGADEEPLT